jgi:hypothetical protein
MSRVYLLPPKRILSSSHFDVPDEVIEGDAVLTNVGIARARISAQVFLIVNWIHNRKKQDQNFTTFC